MKSFLRFAFPAISFLLVVGAAAVPESKAQLGDLRKILTKMDVYNKGLVSLRAEIMVGKQNTQLGDDPVIRAGILIYAKRDKKESLIRIDWKKPNESLAVVDGEYTLFKPVAGKGIAYKGSSSEAKRNQKGNSALIFLNMSKERLDVDYTTAYMGEATLSDGTRTIQVQLTPKGKTSHKSADIWIDVNGMLRQARIIENNNDITTLLLLKGFTPNPSLKRSDFEIDLPKGTKVERT